MNVAAEAGRRKGTRFPDYTPVELGVKSKSSGVGKGNLRPWSRGCEMLKWRLIAAGNYESADGRWTLTVDPLKRKEWTLYDRSRKDPVVPEYQWMQRVGSLSHGKSVAERELRKERTALKERVKAVLTSMMFGAAPMTHAEKADLVQLLEDIEKAL